jgi:hypothetical protein
MIEIPRWLSKALEFSRHLSLVSTSTPILWDRPDFPASLADPDKAAFSFVDRKTQKGAYGVRLIEDARKEDLYLFVSFEWGVHTLSSSQTRRLAAHIAR